jgi:hypothetical protein
MQMRRLDAADATVERVTAGIVMNVDYGERRRRVNDRKRFRGERVFGTLAARPDPVVVRLTGKIAAICGRRRNIADKEQNSAIEHRPSRPSDDLTHNMPACCFIAMKQRLNAQRLRPGAVQSDQRRTIQQRANIVGDDVFKTRRRITKV